MPPTRLVVLGAAAAAVSLRPMDDRRWLSTETHDLLDCPSEEHGEGDAGHLCCGVERALLLKG